MATMDASAARTNFAAVLDGVEHEATVIARHGQPVAAVVSYEFYVRAMAALEDAADVAAFAAALAEEGPNIPWEQVKADLGWT